MFFFTYHFFSDTSLSRLGAFGDGFTDDEREVNDRSNTTLLPSSSAASLSKASQLSSKAYKPPKTLVFQWPNLLRSTLRYSISTTFDFNGKYIGWPLERVCNETEYQPGLVFHCDNNSGGIGNIRNFILTCIRYAIDAGATGIMLPKIRQCSEKDLSNLFTTSLQPFDYFFDEQHFRSTMGASCPRIVIYNFTEDIPNSENKIDIKEFYPKDLNNPEEADNRGENRHLDMFRTKFDKWLTETNRTPKVSRPVTIRFKWARFFKWPIYRDGPEFAATFGDILRARKDIADLAATTLIEMSRYVGFDPYAQEVPTLEAPYLGVQLRSESDALSFWPSSETQTNGSLEVANKTKLRYAYLACGNASDSQQFAEKAWSQLNLNVTSKLDLLKGDDLKRLQDLSWDQQALVDYLVPSKSTHFTGCSFSTFTMNIAFKRHLMTGGINTGPWKSPGDAYSTLVGRYERWRGDWMFMYECMWP
ncbi:hypothetical protein NA56DRAFT_755186 [Hyaloscypha hepaticicola]|uniref:Uncharacterized protein n=1 Tax=Hyaloscypha hepaticicola TaxID=2082293 RepID=A0A2J6PJ15_9HELO|nr:hypothetical protein NA56DRAFT_755186 [Hyaloscypha hepaticicola]